MIYIVYIGVLLLDKGVCCKAVQQESRALEQESALALLQGVGTVGVGTALEQQSALALLQGTPNPLALEKRNPFHVCHVMVDYSG